MFQNIFVSDTEKWMSMESVNTYHLIKETLELRWVPVQLLCSNYLKSLILKIGPCYDLPEHNDLP